MTNPNRNDGHIVYDPRGSVDAESRLLAPRVRQLEGLRLAVLDNTKWNANKLLRRTVGKLGEEIRFGTVNYYRKESFSRVAAPSLIAEIAANNDILLTAVGD